jgi:hypothetical protein
MKMNIYIVKTTSPTGASLISNHCSGVISAHIRRAALLVLALGIPAVLATGCSSTGTGFHAGLIDPAPAQSHAGDPGSDRALPYHHAATFEDNNWYQPSRSPAFDSDLFGG